MRVYTKKRACFLGSFNPIHLGHLNIIDRLMGLYDEIHIIPSPHNPHKNESELLPYTYRSELIELALEDCNNGVYLKMNYYTTWKKSKTKVILNTIEENMSKPSYTYLTLRKLTKQFGEKPSIILGTDTINNLNNWKKYYEIISYPIIHSVRPGIVLDISYNDNIERVVSAKSNISATDIRRYMSNPEDMKIAKPNLTPNVFKSLSRHYNLNNLDI